MSMNIALLVGRLGADPEMSSTSSGDSFVKLSLATNEVYKDKSGERQERTQWHKVVVWNNKLAEMIGKHYKKGDTVSIQGQIENRAYESDGITKYISEVVVGRFTGSVRLILTGNSSSTKSNNSNKGGLIQQAKAIQEESPDIPF